MEMRDPRAVRRDPRAVRTALVGLLLVIGAVLLQAPVPAPPAHFGPVGGPTVGPSDAPLWPSVWTVAALVALVVWRAVQRARRRSHEEPDIVVEQQGVRVHPAVAALLFLTTLIAPWLLLALARHLALPTPGTSRVPHHTTPIGHTGGSRVVPTHVAVPEWLVVVVVGMVVLLFLVLVLARLGRSPTPQSAAPTTAPREPGPEATAVAGARRAVRESGSYRHRIINAFAAMEAALSAQGVARGSSETPDELLARLSRLHPGLSEDAVRLTETFQYARFSSAPVTHRHVEVATAALRRLEDALGARHQQEGLT